MCYACPCIHVLLIWHIHKHANGTGFSLSSLAFSYASIVRKYTQMPPLRMPKQVWFCMQRSDTHFACCVLHVAFGPFSYMCMDIMTCVFCISSLACIQSMRANQTLFGSPLYRHSKAEAYVYAQETVWQHSWTHEPHASMRAPC